MIFMSLSLTLVRTTGPSLSGFRTVGMPLCDSPSSPIDLQKDNWLPSPPEAAEVSKTMVQNCDGCSPNSGPVGAPHNSSPAAGLE